MEGLIVQAPTLLSANRSLRVLGPWLRRAWCALRLGRRGSSVSAEALLTTNILPDDKDTMAHVSALKVVTVRMIWRA